ncbi:EamA family transporter [Lewinellaceae bacterium SD302]|nr:EamA family transporter [Lewinellaceae bacterium SD302]
MDRERLLLLGAFGVIYFVWGSTYLANYWAIQTIPPFLMCGGRFLLAGLLLYSYTYLFRKRTGAPTLRQWKNAALIGILFLGVGTGATVWAQQFIPTSLTALIVAFDPLLIMLLLWWLIGIRPAGRAFLGAAISIIGVSMLVGQPQLSGSPDSVKGLLAIGTALLAWAIASIYVSRIDMGADRVRATAMQMIAGGVLIFLFSIGKGDLTGFTFAQVDARSFGSWLYLVFFGSILAFSAFNYLLARVSPEKVATSTYVNPVVALLLGGWLNNEMITRQSLLAGAIMLTGVYFINSTGDRKKTVVKPTGSEQIPKK